MYRSNIMGGWHHRKGAFFVGVRFFSKLPKVPVSRDSLEEQYLKRGSVYVHWPYCRQRCSYCNFVKFIPHPNAPWTLQDEVIEDAMVCELQQNLCRSHITSVCSVFFGGGTPSLARPLLVQKILKAISDVCYLEDNAEITLEVNPTSSEMRKLENFRNDGGINRISIGLQSLDDRTLKMLGRDHNARDALNCIGEAQRLYSGRVSLDVIFGWPTQTLQKWRRELLDICSLCDDHVSLYQLTVEPGTKLAQQVKSGMVKMACDDEMGELYESAVVVLGEKGLHRYEVSNFARNIISESIHNKGYWQASQYIGVGPGAHSRLVPVLPQVTSDTNSAALKYETQLLSDMNYKFQDYSNNNCEKETTSNILINSSNSVMEESNTDIALSESDYSERNKVKYNVKDMIREARVNAADPGNWLKEIKYKGTGVRKIERQTRLDVAEEYLASGLRTSEGVLSNRWSVFLPSHHLMQIFSGEIEFLHKNNMIQFSPTGLKASHYGMNVLDSFLPNLLAVLNKKVKQ